MTKQTGQDLSGHQSYLAGRTRIPHGDVRCPGPSCTVPPGTSLRAVPAVAGGGQPPSGAVRPSRRSRRVRRRQAPRRRVRSSLVARGIELPEGSPDDPPSAETAAYAVPSFLQDGRGGARRRTRLPQAAGRWYLLGGGSRGRYPHGGAGGSGRSWQQLPLQTLGSHDARVAEVRGEHLSPPPTQASDRRPGPLADLYLSHTAPSSAWLRSGWTLWAVSTRNAVGQSTQVDYGEFAGTVTPPASSRSRPEPRYEERLPGGCHRGTDRCRAPRSRTGRIIRWRRLHDWQRVQAFAARASADRAPPGCSSGPGLRRWCCTVGCTTSPAPATATPQVAKGRGPGPFRSGSVIAPMQAAGTSHEHQ
jgi:hypothetical protein